MDIVVTVKEIKGHCPTYRVGDSFRLKAGYQLVSDTPVCMHALASLMPYYKEDDSKAYIQCPDPFDCTNGGTVIFEISKE